MDLQTNNAQSTDLQVMNFHGDQITTFELDGQPHVAMRPIVENLGLSWGGQRDKIRAQSNKFNCTDIRTTGRNGNYIKMLSIPIKKLNLWLASINPNKIKDKQKRQRIELYQEESAEALYSYWHQGIAIKGDLDGVITDLDPKVMNNLGGMFKRVLNKAMNEVVPLLVEQQLASKEIGIVYGVTTYDIYAMINLHDRTGLRGLGTYISNRLARYHNERGIPIKARDYGHMASVRVFDKLTTKDWLASGGRKLISDYIAEKRGQPSLQLLQGGK
ncbi:antirepressor protein ant [Maritalea myrionectae]|uniref:Antirepressor protein ant n=1 Tax=Maritalea myrionectae TaxID=454601 RepID=A0A2R4MEC7_9HYPH|nr:phage antirepressor N-terminal domain-containing protein [Maritalea myrionectae]AVX04246.1 antirepressor protein ant [Maritalea myrionectae]